MRAWLSTTCVLSAAVTALACPPTESGPTAPREVTGHSVPTTWTAVVTKPPPPAPVPVAAPPSPTAGIPDALVQAAAAIEAASLRAKTEASTRSWDRLAEMVDRFGHRLSGSRALEQAIDWGREAMEAEGLANVHEEKVMVPAWSRGTEWAKVVAPVQRDLVMLGLGNSVGTGGRVLRRDLVAFETLEALQAAGEADPSAMKDKIVLINQAMPHYDRARPDASGYGTTVQIRGRGPSIAAGFGAKGVLIRSVTAHAMRNPHTGSLRYDDDAPKIPAFALAPEDADFLERVAARGDRVTIQMYSTARMGRDVPSANLIAEIPGREKPEEVVVIGGHIDSWDVGDGATDDGSGCVMAWEALTLIRDAGLQPRRTIRLVWWTNEENGLRGAKAYHAEHGDEVHVGAIEADAGAGAPRGFSIKASGDDADAQVAAVAGLAPLFASLGADRIEAGWGGADISPLTADGVLGIALRPDGSHYFDLHHSPADTIDKIDPDHLQRNAAAMAIMAFALAERDDTTPPEAAPVPESATAPATPPATPPGDVH